MTNAPLEQFVWQHLLSTYDERATELPESSLQVRGIWNCEYALRATPQSSTLRLKFVLVQTEGQGCCHLQAEDDIRRADILEWTASDLFRSTSGPDALSIAALDAVYASFIGVPAIDQVLLGTNAAKASRRARVVCTHALRLLDEHPTKNATARILNVGLIGDFLAYLRERRPDILLQATDFASAVVNREFHGVRVAHGSRTPRLLADADVAIVTGMTLQTNTLDEIIAVARANNTRIVMFAETGANFAEEYCRLGIDVVVSEPFPFYLMGSGPSELRIYRKQTRREEAGS